MDRKTTSRKGFLTGIAAAFAAAWAVGGISRSRGKSNAGVPKQQRSKITLAKDDRSVSCDPNA